MVPFTPPCDPLGQRILHHRPNKLSARRLSRRSFSRIVVTCSGPSGILRPSALSVTTRGCTHNCSDPPVKTRTSSGVFKSRGPSFPAKSNVRNERPAQLEHMYDTGCAIGAPLDQTRRMSGSTSIMVMYRRMRLLSIFRIASRS
jgi:hypothetical protein